MTEKTPHTFTATKGAAYRLAEHLAQPGWFTGTVQAYRGGALAEALQLEIASPERSLVKADGEKDGDFDRRVFGVSQALKTWDKEPYSRPLTDAERDVARACIKKFCSDGRFQVDANGVALLKGLGLDVEG